MKIIWYFKIQINYKYILRWIYYIVYKKLIIFKNYLISTSIITRQWLDLFIIFSIEWISIIFIHLFIHSVIILIVFQKQFKKFNEKLNYSINQCIKNIFELDTNILTPKPHHIWRFPRLSELTSIFFNMELFHIGS